MSLFRGFFGGGNENDRDEDGGEVVEKLVERVETSEALEDRRDALRALRGVAKRMRLHVGTMGLNVFLEILQKEQSNGELIFTTLDILVAVLSSDDENTDEDELGERLAEVMIRKPPFIPSVLASVEQFDFAVRRSAIQLLTSVLRHRGTEVQNLIIQQPMGVTKLVDLLHDNREVVRNEAVLMLCELSRANTQVQQLLAYDNAFVLLFDVVDSEPLDSIVVEDCLFVILNLLKKNSMNQQLFRENNLIARLSIVLHQFLFGSEDEEAESAEGGMASEWPKQRTANVIFLLQIVRALVAPDNGGNNTHAAQKAMHQNKMLAELSRALLSEMGVSVDVLTETVVAVAEIIRGNYTNQEFFASTSLTAQDTSVRPSLIVLLVSMTSERQPFKLRCAVFYCFLSYLYDNEFGKTKIIETLLPSSHQDNSQFSTGGLLCQAIASSETIQCWFGCVSLLHCVLEVEHLREQLLRVQLTALDTTTTLIAHVASMLVSAGNRRVQARAGLLMLLGTWLHECPAAVNAFVAHDECIHHLSAQMLDDNGDGTESENQVLKGLVAFLLLTCRNNIKNEKTLASFTTLLDRRIGKERLADSLEGLSRTEQFVRAAQKAQPLAKTPGELFLDYYYIKLFKAAEGNLLKSLRSTGDVGSSNNNDTIIQSFKDLIKRQDEEISVLKQEAKRTAHEMETLRANNSKSDLERELEETRQRLEATSIESEKTKGLELHIQNLMSSNQQWQAEVEKYKAWAQQWQSFQLTQIPNGSDVAFQQLQYQQSQLEQQLQYGWQAFEAQSQQLAAATEECEKWKKKAEELEAKEAEKQQIPNGHSNESSDEVARLKSEQEDLLVLLADQHDKMSQYRKRLRALGQNISDDEDE